MTFTEAAVHVLRLVGKPLHYKEITDVAIEKDLLSHVGKSPEVTMGARLAAVVKKGDKDNPLARVKPGVFALVEWDQETINKGLADRTPALKKIAQLQQEQPAEPVVETPTEDEPAPPTADESVVNLPVPSLEGDGEDLGEDEIARAEMSAAATELFEAEDDDDVPILGGDDDEEEEDNKRRNRRGRRRRRGGERDDDDLPSYTVSEASDDVVAEAVDEARDEESGDGERDRGEGGERERERGRGRRGRERDRDREDKNLEELAAGSLADAVEDLLQGYRRSGSAAPRQLAESASKKQKGSSDQQAIVAACRADNLRRQAERERPRFRFLQNGKIALAEWSLDKDLLRLEKEARSQIRKYQDAVRQKLLKKISDLPPRAVAELVIVLLERVGYSNFRPIKRQGGHSSELHFAATLQTAAGEVPVAVLLRRDGRDLGRERVTDLRGSLHHYGQAALGLLVTTGSILSGARDEAAVVGATPVTFIDGQQLVKLCEQYGVGLTPAEVSLSVPDTEFFDALRAS